MLHIFVLVVVAARLANSIRVRGRNFQTLLLQNFNLPVFRDFAATLVLLNGDGLLSMRRGAEGMASRWPEVEGSRVRDNLFSLVHITYTSAHQL